MGFCLIKAPATFDLFLPARTELLAQQLADLVSRLLNFLLTGVGVDVQRGGDVGVAADALDGLEVHVGLRQRGMWQIGSG